MAFSGTAPGIPEDVALLCYHADDGRTTAADVSRLVQLDSKHEYAGYLPEFYALFQGDDGRWWLVEELLAQPLSDIAPLRDVGKFVRIARDLCRAVTCVHSQGLVHRDIKTENCGVDQHDRAKIFDLGSLVSAPGGDPCTVFSQPPNILRSQSEKPPIVGMADDVWALGATLFAIRSGNYPFATAEDVERRKAINDDLAQGRIDRDQAQSMKAPLNAEIRKRASAVGAEADLMRKVHEYFAGTVADLLCHMLQFDPNARDAIGEYDRQWSEIAEALDSPSGVLSARPTAWADVSTVLAAFERGEISLTSSHIEKLLQEYLSARAGRAVESTNLEAQLRSAKSLAEEASLRRRRVMRYSPDVQRAVPELP